MPRLKNIEELKKIRQEAQKDLAVRTQTGTRIIVGMGTCGIAAGAREVHPMQFHLARVNGFAHRIDTVDQHARFAPDLEFVDQG